VERVLSYARQQDLQELVPALGVAALIAQMRGEMNVAVDLVDELVTATRHNAPWRSHYLPTLVRILITAGEVVEAQSMIEDIDVTATRHRNCILSAQAIVAEATGDNVEAYRLYEEAGRAWLDYRFLLEEGQAHLGLARCLIALSRGEDAVPKLRQASGIFDRLKARPLIEEADLLPQRVHGARFLTRERASR
jgi:ATP/maltotriose-dependent transcriptional regulator MalT